LNEPRKGALLSTGGPDAPRPCQRTKPPRW
jgi:hypothetical protein